MTNFTLIFLLLVGYICQAQFSISPMVQTVEGFEGDEITATVTITATGSSMNSTIFNMFMCDYDAGYQSGMTDGILEGGQSQTLTFKFKKPSISSTHSFTYTFTINQATDRCSDDSNHIKITVKYKLPPCNYGSPGGLSANALSHKAIKFNWSRGFGESPDYYIEYKKASDVDWTVYGSASCFTSPCNVTLNNLLPSTSYHIRIKSSCNSENSTEFSYLGATTLACPTGLPAGNLNATPWSYGYTISFTPISGVNTYFLEWFDLTTNTAGGTTQITYSPTPNNGNFFYYIPAGHDFKFRLYPYQECPGYASAWKTIYSPVCSLTVPSTMTLVNYCGYGSGGQCGYGTFSWSAVTGADLYEIEYIMYNLNGQSTTRTFTKNTTSSTQPNMNTSGGTWYVKWKIRSRCSSNNAWSSWSDYTTPLVW